VPMMDRVGGRDVWASCGRYLMYRAVRVLYECECCAGYGSWADATSQPYVGR
jgi:hypothetical protein